jgi:hypothetical protein
MASSLSLSDVAVPPFPSQTKHVLEEDDEEQPKPKKRLTTLIRTEDLGDNDAYESEYEYEYEDEDEDDAAFYGSLMTEQRKAHIAPNGRDAFTLLDNVRIQAEPPNKKNPWRALMMVSLTTDDESICGHCGRETHAPVDCKTIRLWHTTTDTTGVVVMPSTLLTLVLD